MTNNPAGPVHPGEILREEFLAPLGITAYRVGKACGIPEKRLQRLVKEQTGVSADTALRLGAYFGTSPQFWMNLQTLHDLEKCMPEIMAEVEQIEPYEPDNEAAAA